MIENTTLTSLERMALEGLEARQRLLANEQTAVNEAFEELKRTLEGRMELEPGALGTTHQLNPQTWQVEHASAGEWGDALETNAAANGGETS